jgi:hypothetical protein
LVQQAAQVPGDRRQQRQLAELIDGDEVRFDPRFPGLRFGAGLQAGTA